MIQESKGTIFFTPTTPFPSTLISQYLSSILSLPLAIDYPKNSPMANLTKIRSKTLGNLTTSGLNRVPSKDIMKSYPPSISANCIKSTNRKGKSKKLQKNSSLSRKS
jgi:hypothetical protein